MAGAEIWYLSFWDEVWLGAAFVHGINGVDAIRAAHVLGCNPGGEVKLAATNYPIPERWIGRLLDREGLQAMARDLGEGDRLVPWSEGD